MPTRYHLGTQTIATGDAAGVMAALAALFAVATDVDTGASTSGMLTWTRDTTSGSQAIYSNAFGPRNCRIVIAVHDSGTPSPSPTMQTDTYVAANILIGLCTGASGAYAGWNQAAPFSGCSFAGYNRFASASLASGAVRAIMSSRDLWLISNASGGGTVELCHVGAIGTMAAAYAESDGYRYGMLTSGVGDTSASWRTALATTAGNFGRHSASAGSCHGGVYRVGASTWDTCQMANVSTASSTTSCTLDGFVSRQAPVAIPLCRVTSGEVVGSWSGVYDARQGYIADTVLTDGATVIGFHVGSATSGTEDCVWIRNTF